MKLTPIQNTNFTGYGPKDVSKLRGHILKQKQGALCDLYKKFDVNLVNNFVMTKRIDVAKFSQNWKLGEFAETPVVQHVLKVIKGGRFSKVGH